MLKDLTSLLIYPWRTICMFERHVSAEDCFPPLRGHFRILFAGVLILSFLAVNATLRAQSPGGPTRLLRTPTISDTQIAFAYANNIWVVSRTGGSARRLTSFQGQTTNPQIGRASCRD